MVELAMASYLSLYPALLLPPHPSPLSKTSTKCFPSSKFD